MRARARNIEKRLDKIKASMKLELNRTAGSKHAGKLWTELTDQERQEYINYLGYSSVDIYEQVNDCIYKRKWRERPLERRIKENTGLNDIVNDIEQVISDFKRKKGTNEI